MAALNERDRLSPMSAAPTQTFDPERNGWTPRRSQGPFTQLVGPIWTRRETEGSACAFLAEERHANGRGVVHGGMLMSFADHALGWLVWDAVERRACATVSLNNQFIAAAKPGDWVEMRGRIVRKTRSLIFVQGAMNVGDRIVLTAEGIWKVLGVD